MNILIAGINGYFGRVLSRYLIDTGFRVFGVDRNIDYRLENINYQELDLSIAFTDATLFPGVSFDILVDLATEIDFAAHSMRSLYLNNVNIVSNLIDFAVKRDISRYIYTSSNSVYLGNESSFIKESDLPVPEDEYGRSKVTCEQLLLNNHNGLSVSILRCPNIIDAGRIGMLSILFELLEENATIWTIDSGSVIHQCIYAQDLCVAISLLFKINKSEIYNIGCDNVESFHSIFVNLIKRTNSNSKIRSIPKWLALPILKFLYFIGMSPMGAYQFRMLTKDYVSDVSKLKNEINWNPTLDNASMLSLAYDYYIKNKNSLYGSANSAPVKMGFLNILKYIKI